MCTYNASSFKGIIVTIFILKYYTKRVLGRVYCSILMGVSLKFFTFIVSSMFRNLSNVLKCEITPRFTLTQDSVVNDRQ